MNWISKYFTSGGEGERLQLMFYNDNTFEYRYLPIKDASLVIMDGDDVKLGWPSFNKILKDFPGLGNLKPARVLISCENDVIFDMFDELSEEEKPKKGGGLVNDWIKARAETVRYRWQSKPRNDSVINRLILFLGIGLTLEILIWGLIAVQKNYGIVGGG